MENFGGCRVNVQHLDVSPQVFLIPVWPESDLRSLPLDWLDAQEQQTARGFVHARDRHLYIQSHLWLRYLLAQARGCTPQSLQLVRSEQGKPRLADGSQPLYFNLSHTHSCIAIALSTRGEVGVDIERVDGALDTLALQDLVLHPVERDQQPDKTLFFRLWTLKEAYAKALGLGLGLPFARLAMTIDPQGAVSLRDETGFAALSSGLSLQSRMLSVERAGIRQDYTLGLAAPISATSPGLHIVDNHPDRSTNILALRA